MKQHIDRNDAKAWFISVVISSICMLLLLAGISMLAWTYYNQNQSNFRIIKTKHI